MAYDSVTTWRVYEAEHSVGLGEPLEDVHAARALVRKIKRSKWWRENVTDRFHVFLEIRGEDDGVRRSSYARPSPVHLPQRWTISIHPGMLNDLVVLHELAHCIAPRWSHSTKRRQEGQIPDHARLGSHAAGFAGAMAELVREFATGAVHDELRDAYRHFGVPVQSREEYREAVAASLEAERDFVAFLRELDEYQASRSATLDSAERGWIPEPGWGYPFFRARVRPRIGMDRLAKIVSQVEPCTRTDIRKIEFAQSRPDDLRLCRVALCMAVAYGFDPVHMGHQMGLELWVELDELRSINAEWVDLVETMNRLLDERPPKWVVDGDR